MTMFKVTYRAFGEITVRDAAGNLKTHVNPSSFVDVTVYREGGMDGGVNMKELKGHIRKEIGDTFYEFREIVKVGETL